MTKFPSASFLSNPFLMITFMVAAVPHFAMSSAANLVVVAHDQVTCTMCDSCDNPCQPSLPPPPPPPPLAAKCPPPPLPPPPPLGEDCPPPPAPPACEACDSSSSGGIIYPSPPPPTAYTGYGGSWGAVYRPPPSTVMPYFPYYYSSPHLASTGHSIPTVLHFSMAVSLILHFVVFTH